MKLVLLRIPFEGSVQLQICNNCYKSGIGDGTPKAVLFHNMQPKRNYSRYLYLYQEHSNLQGPQLQNENFCLIISCFNAETIWLISRCKLAIVAI